nr:hypothetical protein [Gammaproteobacteria bacterium]
RGYLDLSKRTVNEQDIEATKQKYRDGKLINTIMNQVALETNIELRSLYESLVWPLYQQHNVLTTLQAATVDPSVLEDFNLSAPILSSITKQCQKYMKPKMLKLNAHVQVTCFTPEGIDVIKDGFALAIQDSNPPVKATLIAPPVYLLSTECMDKQSGIDVLTRSLDLLGELVTSRGGQVEIKKQPDVMHQDDERQLGAIIERLNQHNQEVDGDDIGDD